MKPRYTPIALGIAPWIHSINPTSIVELLVLWDGLITATRYRDQQAAVAYVARYTRLSIRQIEFARDIRNICAHPSNRGVTSRQQLQKAIDITKKALTLLDP